MEKVFIKVVETDGLKSAHEAYKTQESILKVVSKYLPTMKTIMLNDYEISNSRNIQLTIQEFLNEHI